MAIVRLEPTEIDSYKSRHVEESTPVASPSPIEPRPFDPQALLDVATETADAERRLVEAKAAFDLAQRVYGEALARCQTCRQRLAAFTAPLTRGTP